MDGFADWVALAWAWFIDWIGGYTNLIGLVVLAIGCVLGVDYVTRKWQDARKERAIPQQETEQQDEWDMDGIMAAAEYHLGLREEVGE